MFKLINFKRKKLSFVKKWEQYGFLEGVSNKERLSDVYEKTSNIFLFDDNIKKLKNYDKLSILIFAIIYRFNKDGVTFNSDDELYTLIEKLNDGYDRIKDLLGHSTLDLEAEFCHTFVNEYVK
jgi:hypothetical protein